MAYEEACCSEQHHLRCEGSYVFDAIITSFCTVQASEISVGFFLFTFLRLTALSEHVNYTDRENKGSVWQCGCGYSDVSLSNVTSLTMWAPVLIIA